jgi:exosortase
MLMKVKAIMKIGDHIDKTAVILLSVLTFVLLVYWETLISIFGLWLGEGNKRYTHGLLLLVACAAICHRRWQANKLLIGLAPSIAPSLALLAVSFISLLVSIADILIVQQILLLVSLYLALACIVGFNISIIFIRPMLLLLAIIPVWEYLNTPLQLLATHAATFILYLSNVSVVNEGFYIYVPAGVFYVDASCSGLGQFIVALSAALLYINIVRCSIKTGSAIIICSLVLSFVVNAFRIYIIIIAGQATDMQHYLVVNEHRTFGWVFFSIAMLLYFYFVDRLIVKNKTLSNKPVSIPADTKFNQHKKSVNINIFYILLIFPICGIPAFSHLIKNKEHPQFNIDSLRIPDKIEKWTIIDTTRSLNRTEYGFDMIASYSDDKLFEIDTKIQYYAHQKQGVEAVSDSNLPYDPNIWKPKSRWTIEFADRGFTGTAEQILVETMDGRYMLVLKAYYINGNITGSEVLAKLYNTWGTLNGSPQASVITFIFIVDNPMDLYVTTLDKFSRSALPEYIAILESLKQG